MVKQWFYAFQNEELTQQKTSCWRHSSCNEKIHEAERKSLLDSSSESLGNPCNDSVNTLRPRQNGCHFTDDIFKCIFLNENVWIPIKISLKFVPKGPINNIPALVQIMAWRRPMMLRLPTHICVTRPQWVNVIDEHASVAWWGPIYFDSCMDK